VIFQVGFWKGAGERAIKTFFQSFVALIGTAQLVQAVDWKVVVSGSLLATILSLATSVGNADFTSGNATPNLAAATPNPGTATP
jgi:hypothetical protein